MQVRAEDSSRRNANNCVSRFLNLRLGDSLKTDVADAAVDDGYLHSPNKEILAGSMCDQRNQVRFALSPPMQGRP